MFDRLFDNTSVPVLAEVMNFAASRQVYLANNIANVDTPGFRASDLSEAEFNQVLAEAVDKRRRLGGGLQPASSRNVKSTPQGLEFQPVQSGGLMRIDGNDVSLDLELAKMSKNAMKFQMAARMLAARFRFYREVVRERMR